MQRFSAEIAAPVGWAGGAIQVRLASGVVIGTLTVGQTASLTTYRWQTAAIQKVTGLQDIYLTFTGRGFGNIRAIRFA